MELAYDPRTRVGRALSRAGVAAAELEAGLDGREMPAAAFAEAAGGARNRLLEAIVLRVGRPSYLIVGNEVDWESGEAFPEDVRSRVDALRPSYLAVGRVEVLNHPTFSWIGTAWLVGTPDGPVAVTNRHVAEEFSVLRPGGRVVLRSDPRSLVPIIPSIDFRRELRTPDVQEVRVVGVRYLARPNDPDVALLRLAPSPHLAPAFDLADAEARADDLVATIGYPASDSRNAADAQFDIFGDVYDVKRLAPGKVMQATGPGAILRHDASTLGGASGSPLISLDTGRVVGLHFSGRYLEANAAVSVASIKAALAGTVVAVPDAFGRVAAEGRADGTHAASHFGRRGGYLRGFLAGGTVDAAVDGGTGPLGVELPRPTGSRLAELVDGPGGHELRYTHFSVLYDADRRCPRLTAVNIDGSRAVKIRRGDDKWFKDLRIDPGLQLGSDDFVGDIDRGHMVRREDPNWGDAGEAALADGDTFHYTNAALQHALLNRSRERWLGLEDYVLRSARTHGFRASVFTGPVLEDSDPELTDRPGLQVPRAFWKVVVMVAEGGQALHATGYVLGQADFVRAMTESFEFGDLNLFQVPISRIAAGARVDFGGLERFDPLATGAETESPNGGVVLLERLEQIVL